VPRIYTDRIAVAEDVIDQYRHVGNLAYLGWMQGGARVAARALSRGGRRLHFTSGRLARIPSEVVSAFPIVSDDDAELVALIPGPVRSSSESSTSASPGAVRQRTIIRR
jgi:hypothetical protein